MIGNDRKTKPLTAKQTSAIEALLTEPTQEKAAARVGVATITVRRWLSEPVFKQALDDARRALHDAVILRLQSLGQTAAETLEDVMRNAINFPSSRVSAAKHVLDLTGLVQQQNELEERLAALEAAAKATGGPK